jgi:integrase/recombinase XerD
MVDYIWQFLENAKNTGNISDDTFRVYEKDINDLRIYIRDKNIAIENIDIYLMGQYVSHLMGKYKVKTAYRKLSSIRIFYKYLLESKIIEKIPIGNYDFNIINSNNEKIPNQEEYQKLLEQFDDTKEGKRDRILTEIIYETSLKNTDIFSLEMRDVRRYDYKSLLLMKKGKFIIKKFSKNIENKLKEYSRIYPDENIFDKKIEKDFNKNLMECGKKAGFMYNITTNIIRNSKLINDQAVGEKDSKNFLKNIKEIYLKIGIGDDN